jgi:hypothetical protein
MNDDPAGPLWLLFERLLESLPVRPKWILLAGLVVLVIAALVKFAVASSKRRE